MANSGRVLERLDDLKKDLEGIRHELKEHR